eukprot:2401933-Pleurochrysis_carterae.AAC.1
MVAAARLRFDCAIFSMSSGTTVEGSIVAGSPRKAPQPACGGQQGGGGGDVGPSGEQRKTSEQKGLRKSEQRKTRKTGNFQR